MKGHISAEMHAGRILSHGKIESLPFTLGEGVPFSVFFHPKEDTEETVAIIPVKLYQDAQASDCPFVVNQWSECAVTELGGDSSLLDQFDVYYGAGQPI